MGAAKGIDYLLWLNHFLRFAAPV